MSGVKGKVTIYRLENPKGIGPYECRACETHNYGYGPRHPTPYNDGIGGTFTHFENRYPKTYNKHKVKFAFKSMDQLYDWFPQDIISKFHLSHDIHIVAKEVREDLVKYGNKQVMFYDIRSPSKKIDYEYYPPLTRVIPPSKSLTEALNIINRQ